MHIIYQMLKILACEEQAYATNNMIDGQKYMVRSSGGHHIGCYICRNQTIFKDIRGDIIASCVLGSSGPVINIDCEACEFLYI